MPGRAHSSDSFHWTIKERPNSAVVVPSDRKLKSPSAADKNKSIFDSSVRRNHERQDAKTRQMNDEEWHEGRKQNNEQNNDNFDIWKHRKNENERESWYNSDNEMNQHEKESKNHHGKIKDTRTHHDKEKDSRYHLGSERGHKNHHNSGRESKNHHETEKTQWDDRGWETDSLYDKFDRNNHNKNKNRLNEENRSEEHLTPIRQNEDQNSLEDSYSGTKTIHEDQNFHKKKINKTQKPFDNKEVFDKETSKNDPNTDNLSNTKLDEKTTTAKSISASSNNNTADIYDSTELKNGVNKTKFGIQPEMAESKAVSKHKAEDPLKIYGFPKELMPIMPGGGSRFDDVEREKLEKKKMSQMRGGDESAESGGAHEAESLYSSASLSSLSCIFYYLVYFYRLDYFILL